MRFLLPRCSLCPHKECLYANVISSSKGLILLLKIINTKKCTLEVFYGNFDWSVMHFVSLIFFLNLLRSVPAWNFEKICCEIVGPVKIQVRFQKDFDPIVCVTAEPTSATTYCKQFSMGNRCTRAYNVNCSWFFCPTRDHHTRIQTSFYKVPQWAILIKQKMIIRLILASWTLWISCTF